jgi:hypothetical protein
MCRVGTTGEAPIATVVVAPPSSTVSSAPLRRYPSSVRARARDLARRVNRVSLILAG